MNGAPPIRVTSLAAETRDGLHRVTAQVDGAEFFFESPDLPLRPSAEAVACALLPVALQRGRRLELDAPLDPAWRAGLPEVLSAWQAWWGLPGEADAVLAAPAAPPAATAPAAGVGQCFSGGIDSFFSLRRGPRRPHLLIGAHGFDVWPEDHARMAPQAASLRAVAKETGAAAVVIRTNLRRLPISQDGDWPRSHGGALAALGHLLADHIGTLVIASSYPYCDGRPCGSHPRTDPRWSSARLAIEHHGAELWRDDKVLVLAHDPLVQKHLKVCWENRTASGNCGRCDKCVRTMVMLHSQRRLEDFLLFPRDVPLPRLIDGLNYDPKGYGDYYERLLRLPLSWAVEAAVRRCLVRMGVRPFGWRDQLQMLRRRWHG